MYFVINEIEHKNLVHEGVVSARLAMYWQTFLDRLPVELQNEALTKAFQLVKHPQLGEDNTMYSYNLAFSVPGASNELKEELAKAENVIVCLKDE